MKQLLNKRLETISAFIKDNESIIDIGCDHGLLGIYLFLNRKNVQVVSSDINLFPLKRAKENLIKYDLLDRIELRLGNGLECVTDDIEIIIISGMGGINIVNILKDIKKYPYISKLVLSPNNDFPLVRESISKLGYRLHKEEMVLENNKYYPIMEFIKGKEEIDYFFGKLDLRDEIVLSYYKNLYNKNKRILENISNKDLIQENKLIEEKCKIKE